MAGCSWRGLSKRPKGSRYNFLHAILSDALKQAVTLGIGL
jgi:hypothetical protein